jgi:hypothetical protein
LLRKCEKKRACAISRHTWEGNTKIYLKIELEGVDLLCIEVDKDWKQIPELSSSGMGGKFFSSRASVGFCRRTMHYRVSFFVSGIEQIPSYVNTNFHP